ncbi:partial Teichoic acids export ATP-binding protein TagH, partial [Candidatus Brocadiaceae bacterium]
MSDIVISVENLSKYYRLGTIGTGTLSHDLNRWWARLRGKPDPLGKVDSQQSTVNSSRAKFHPSSRVAIPHPSEEIWALRDVSFEVKQGEVLGIIGRNGAGKSTLLKILSRVTAPTSGEVKVKGRIASLLEVGTGFHPELTGRENIYLNGAILGMQKKEIQRKFEEIVAFAEVEKFIDTPVKRYSSGMYVRLAFAVAAHLEPEILLVDEVLAVGDAAFQKKCLGKMGDVAKEGRTVLFVSHNMAAVTGLCEKVIILDYGSIVATENPSTAIHTYLKLFSTESESLFKGVKRRGEGPIQFSLFHLEAANGDKLDHLISGEPVNLVIGYESHKEQVRNVGVSIVIYSGEGIRLTNLWNEYHMGEPFDSIPGSGNFICKLDKVPFRTGRYIIELFCSVDDKISDWIEQAAFF